jgi:hypothetical protein
VVAAATATRSLPDVYGKPLPANLIQDASLAAMSDLFAIVVADEAELPN